MQKIYPYCWTYFIDIGNVWVFRFEYRSKFFSIKYAALHYVQKETLELIHTQELTHFEKWIFNSYSAPHFLPFCNVEIQNEN